MPNNNIQNNSVALRNSLLSKNFFKPTNVYDLNSNPISTILGNLSAAGFNVRNNPLISEAEGIIQQSPIVKIGITRLGIELGRRFAGNIINDYTINVNSLFDKNPNTKLLSRRVDFRITPSTDNTSSGDKVLGFLKNGAGLINESSAKLFASKQAIVGSKFYYDNLGAGQKQQLNTLIGYNYYGNWVKPNILNLSTSAVDNRINTFVDGRTKPNAGQGMNYITGAFDVANQPDPFQDNKYTDDLNGDAPVGFASTLNSGKIIDNALDVYEFGRTSVEKDSTTDPKQFRDTSGDLVWGDDTTFPTNAKRGLLYYTQHIVKTRTDAGKLLNQTNKSYQIGKNLIYKGTKCRTWTVKDQYDQLSKAIRSQGNGVENSVLKDSVFPHQYPRKIDTQEDKKRYMLSLENLAWSKEDFEAFNIPECERGAFGGRVMWFPFYGVEFSESLGAKWEDTQFIGRIEPIYAYAGATRSATLKFMLIMDYPSTINSFRGNEAAYYANCDNIADGVVSNVITNNKTTGDIAAQSLDTSSKVVPNNKPNFEALSFFFDNDIFTIDLNYEATESNTPPISYGLNANFVAAANQIATTLATQNANNYELRIDGYASQLFTDLYNTQLGYKRAYQLMLYIQSLTNSISTTSDTKLNLEGIENFTDASFKEKTLSDLDKTKVVFKDSARNIIFDLFSLGESQAGSIGAVAQTKDLKEVKQDRKATFTSVGPLKVNDNIIETFTPQPTPSQIIATNNVNSVKDTIGTGTQDNNCFPFKELNPDAKIPMDFEKLDYFVPAYHSQTPEDFHKRLTFLNQITRPGSTLQGANAQGKNSLFGRSPVTILRLGDLIHSKVIIHSVNINYINTWDLNSENAGVQPMLCEVTLDFNIIGGQSLATYIDRLQRGIDFNFYANSTFYGKDYYGNSQKQEGPFYQEAQQLILNSSTNPNNIQQQNNNTNNVVST